MRFGKKGKLSPRFIGPYEVIEKVGPVAYSLVLPLELEKIHNMFHVSMLQRYRSDPSHVLSSETIELRPDPSTASPSSMAPIAFIAFSSKLSLDRVGFEAIAS